MSGGVDLQFGGGAARIGSAILFIQASTNALDVFSALNSSPWTAESFAADKDKADACREYVWHSIGVTSFYAVSASLLARDIWPIVGTGIALAYMYWLYDRALKRGLARNSTGWDSTSQPAAQAAPAVDNTPAWAGLAA